MIKFIKHIIEVILKNEEDRLRLEWENKRYEVCQFLMNHKIV